MASGPARVSVFVSYRRDDTGWAANALREAMRRQLGRSFEVFLDNRWSGLGDAFGQVLEEGVLRSPVLQVLIGPRWDKPPLVDRLLDPQDWVRNEILLAEDVGSTIIPVLVDRDRFPAASSLPPDLRFLRELQFARITQHDDKDSGVLAERVADLLNAGPLGAAPPPAEGVERTYAALDALLRLILPPAQQWMGNGDRLVDLAMTVLGRDDRLVYLVPTRLEGRARGSATVLVTDSDVLVVEVDDRFRLLSGEIRFPRRRIRRVEVAPTLPLFANAIVHTTAGDAVRLQGLFRQQAQQLAGHLNPGPGTTQGLGRSRDEEHSDDRTDANSLEQQDQPDRPRTRRPKFFSVGKADPPGSGAQGSSPRYDDDAWEMFGRALEEPGKGLIYISNDPSPAQVEAIETALSNVAAKRGVTVHWEGGEAGSWFRRFFTSLGQRFGEHDLDTAKRAAEIQALDRYESKSAADYAQAMASLAAAAAGVDHVVLLAKNTVLIKTKNSAAESIVVARTLTSAEVNELSGKPHWLADPQKALDFVTRAQHEEMLIRRRQLDEGDSGPRAIGPSGI